jgi:hypothetical protein
LREHADRLRSESNPYPPLYVQVIGVVGEKDKSGGFAESYDALFHLKNVMQVSEKGLPQCKKVANTAVEPTASGLRPQAAARLLR